MPGHRGQRKRASPRRRILIIGGVVALLGLIVVIVSVVNGRGNTGAGSGCWYTPGGTAAPQGAVAIRLCEPEAWLDQDPTLNALNLVPGGKPANATEICQIETGSGPTGWVGFWADSANQTALGAAKTLCQDGGLENDGRVRYSGFH